MASQTSIQLLFGSLEKKPTSKIPKEFVEKCADEYSNIIKKIPRENRPQRDLIVLIQTVQQGKYGTHTGNLLPKAKEDYQALLEQLDIIRHQALQQVDDKHKASGGSIQTHDPAKIADLTNPQDNNRSNKQQPGKCVQNESTLQKQQLGTEGENHNNTDQRTDSATHGNSKRDVINEQKIPSQTQLSRDASNQLKQNNPNIADLSDTNRPTKLAERFSELYDNEWTNAYEALQNNLRLHEKLTTELLLSIVKGAFQFCTENAELQMNDLQMCCKSIVTLSSEEDKTDDILNDKTGDKSSLLLYRKSIAGLAVKRLQKTFSDDSRYLHTLCSNNGLTKAPLPTGPTVLFANKCVELCWWMCVQDPPVCVDAATDSGFNSTMYRAYTKSGTSVDFYVWPALMLYKGGPVLMKGVAQCK